MEPSGAVDADPVVIGPQPGPMEAQNIDQVIITIIFFLT